MGNHRRKPPFRRSFLFKAAFLVSWLIAVLAAGSCGVPPSELPTQAPATPAPGAISPQAPAGPPLPTATPFLPRPTATATSTPTPLPTPTATAINAIPQSPRTQYRLAVTFDYEGHTLAVEQSVVYPNLTGETLTDLVLVIDPLNHGAFIDLTELTWGNRAPIDAYTLEKSTLTIPLPDGLPPEGEMALDLKYSLRLPNQPAGLGFTLRESLLIDWYPFIPPYKPGLGWLVNRPWPFGEYLAYALGDYEVIIRLANSNPDVMIAAGAPDLDTGEAWHFRLDAARSFAWSASTAYQVLTRQAGEVALSAYIFPEHRAAGEAALETAAEALTFFGELFGPYPRPVYTIVEADFADGREYDGLIFLSRTYHAEYDGTRQNFLSLLAAHETAHQWWYGLVGNDQAGEPWLDEALATYSELLFYERFYPDLANWWWFYRINFFNPQGLINPPLYDFGSFKPYWYAVYMRGALFLRDLRALIGDEAFFTFLQAYARQNVYHEATAVDFFSVLATTSPVDPGRVVDTYFDARYLPGD